MENKLYLINEEMRLTLMQIIQVGLHPNIQYQQINQVVKVLETMEPVEVTEKPAEAVEQGEE